MADRKDDPPLVKRLKDIIKDFDVKGGIIIIKNKDNGYRIAHRGLTRKEAQDALCAGIYNNKKAELDEQIQSN